MVSKKIIIVVFIIAILMFAGSIIIGFSNFDSKELVPVSGNDIKSDTKEGQVSIIINKPSSDP